MADKEIRKDDRSVHEVASDELENVSGGEGREKIVNEKKEKNRKQKARETVV